MEEGMDEFMPDQKEEESEPLMEALPSEGADQMEGVVGMIEDSGIASTSHFDNLVVDENSGFHTMELHNFSTLEGKHYSDNFVVGGHTWNILLFPKGTKGLGEALSMFLNVPDSDSLPVGWVRRASFKLIVINQLDPARSSSKDSSHTFSAREQDWGFTMFLGMDDLRDPAKGFLVDDTLKVRAEVRIETIEGMYDSKKATGYVGLKNQGATCYMNSLLQTLYNINYFRQAVYHMPTTEEDMPSKSIPLALQSLFYKLQFGDTCVSTKDLTKSFGWDTYEAFMQHDVQELNRVLCEKLEDKMKGTKVEGTINKLFEGHTHNFIECIHVEAKSERQESYMDLQLDVKDCKDVYDSFDRYCEVEQLEGDNKYNAEGHGLQEAKKGVLFDSFPPVLQLQLKRFEYDYTRDAMVKLNTRYKFYEELDLDKDEGKYLSPKADRNVVNKYKLHSVLVHSGGVHGGHYFAFIRPDGHTWLKFDDDKVTKEEPKKALDDQFGGEDDSIPPNNQQLVRFPRFSNAYMLVYIRESDWPHIMCNVSEVDIAEHVAARLKKEAEEKDRKRVEKQEAHLFTFLKIATEEDFEEQIGKDRWFDLVDHEKVKVVRVKKQAFFVDVKDQIAEAFNMPVENMRFWHWTKRSNNTYRPSRPLTQPEENTRVETIRDVTHTAVYQPKNSPIMLHLFLETPGPSGSLPPLPHRGAYLMFFKFYNPAKQSLSYAGRLFLPRSSTRADLESSFKKMTGMPEDTMLEVYEEIKIDPFMVDAFPPGVALQNNQNEDGDIFIIQEAVSPEEEKNFKFPHAPGFLEYVKNRQVVTFKKLENPKEEGMSLELSKADTYDSVAARLAEELKLEDPQFLRFTPHNAYTQSPKPNPLRFHQHDTLMEMLSQFNNLSDILYYEVLDMPLPELERLKVLRVEFHGERAGSEVQMLTVRVPKDSTVDTVLEKLKEQLGLDYSDKQLRLMEILFQKIYKVFSDSDKVDQINDSYWTLRAEVIPPEEEAFAAGEFLLHVYHMLPLTDSSGTQVTNFGDPLLLKVQEDETLADIRPRLRAKLPTGVSDEDFAKYKFNIVIHLRQPLPLKDQDVIAQVLPKYPGACNQSEGPYLGLEHVDNLPRRPQNHRNIPHYERPVKIYN